MKLCALIAANHTQRVKGSEPAVYRILDAKLLVARLHGDDEPHNVHPQLMQDMRVCVDLSLVQETFPLEPVPEGEGVSP